MEMSIGPESLKLSKLDVVLDAVPGRPYCVFMDISGGTLTGRVQLSELVGITYGMVRGKTTQKWFILASLCEQDASQM